MSPGLVDLATLATIVDFEYDQDPRDAWQLHGDAAIRMQLALSDCHYRQDKSMRFGNSPVVAVRVLLHSKGRCSGCDFGIDLTGEDARDAVVIRTVDAPAREAPEVLIMDEEDACSYGDGPIALNWWMRRLPADWPGVLCRQCDTRMRDGGYTSLVDFCLSRNPRCPRCWAELTQSALFWLLMHRDFPPWRHLRGCRRTEDIWTCSACGHEWG
jgi:hypothetical protein